MKKSIKKLELGKETVVNLQKDKLVAGAGTTNGLGWCYSGDFHFGSLCNDC